MSITYRSALLLASFALVLPLSACADDDKPEAVATATPDKDVNEDTVKASAFVKQYRVDFPQLADDVTDKVIADHGSEVCDRFEGDDADRDDAINDTSEDFAANGIEPNDDTVIKIFQLAIKTACPERANNLKAVLGQS